MTSALDEFKKPMEEWARSVLDSKPMENLLILYKLLHALGCRMDGIDFEIDRLCLAASKSQKRSVILNSCDFVLRSVTFVSP